MSALALDAATPREWIDIHLGAHMRSYDVEVDEAEREWLTTADLFADDGAHLRASHQRIMREDGATPAAAAKWLVGWYPGRLAHAVGYLYAFASAVVEIDPLQLRFGRHPDGWTQLIDLGRSTVVVAEGHPWADRPEVRVVDDEESLVHAGLTSLVAASRPVLEAARALAKVGLVALWSEVADEFALAGTSSGDLPADPAMLARLNEAVRTVGMPWRKHPLLWVADVGGNPSHVGQKGGCCLAYQCRQTPDAELDADTRAWRERFPGDARGRHYCNTCSLLARADCQERQLFPVAH